MAANQKAKVDTELEIVSILTLLLTWLIIGLAQTLACFTLYPYRGIRRLCRWRPKGDNSVLSPRRPFRRVKPVPEALADSS